MADEYEQLNILLACATAIADTEEPVTWEELRDEIRNPTWDGAGWEFYIPEPMRKAWDTLSTEAKIGAYLVAEGWRQMNRGMGNL
jgi:hypothetical protein